ncbi:MAG: hypothetical protein Q4G04_00410 [bacterium]|nr:hypothetical protein [bacterium]
MSKVSIVTVTLNRDSLKQACESVDNQTFKDYHHYVLGDGILPTEYSSEKRSTLGFSTALGAKEPGANMPNGTPNPLLRWAIKNLDLGEYLCFLDDDNVYKNNYLEEMVKILDTDESIGLVLCGAEDLRYEQNIDGFPELGRCDNSAFMVRKEIAKSIEFPYASLDKNVVQDCEYIKLCCNKTKWKNLNKKLLVFGYGLNQPPKRGKIMYLESWKLPQEAFKKACNKEYELAEEMFLKAIDDCDTDAWTIRKLSELYLIENKKDRAMKYFEMWEKLYLTTKEHHFAVDYSYAIYLKLIGKDYKEKLENSIVEREKWKTKEPDSLEHYYYLYLSYAFLGNQKKCDEYAEIIIANGKDAVLWAYQDVAWNFLAFKDLFDVDYSNMSKFLEVVL